MGRNASIQVFLLTLTGCSWMLLFLSITLSDYHVFRAYRSARVAAAHPPSLRETDPCELCWGLGEPCLQAGVKEGTSRVEEEDPGWSARLAWAVGVGGEKPREKTDASGTPNIGGVGAFYYYTLHTTFTTLRVRLKKAQQVAGDVHEEVTALGEKVAHLHHTLLTHFSPRHNPYTHKSGGKTSSQGEVRSEQEVTITPSQQPLGSKDARPTTSSAHHVAQHKDRESSSVATSSHNSHRLQERGYEKRSPSGNNHHQVKSTLDPHRQENLRRVYPVLAIKPPKEEDSQDASDKVKPGVHTGFTSSYLYEKSQGVHTNLPSQSFTHVSGSYSEGTTRNVINIMQAMSNHQIPLPSDDKQQPPNRVVVPGFSSHQLNSNKSVDLWTQRLNLEKENSEWRRVQEAGTVNVLNKEPSSVGKAVVTEKAAGEEVSDWSSNLGKHDVHRIVSIVLVGGDPGIDGLLTSIGSTYPGITVHLLTSTSSPQSQNHHQLRLVVHNIDSNTTTGAAYTEGVSHVVTPYVLVATDMTSLTSLAHLEKLVWACEHLGVWAVTGGLQTPAGHWHSGCLTSHYAYYQTTWTRGRLGTTGQCILCQSLEGPFLAVTASLRHLGWDTRLTKPVIQLDLFMRAAHTHHMLSASCPGSLFEINNELEPPSRASLLSLARQHSLYVLQAAGGARLTFSCSEVGASCGEAGMALPPCCRQELANLVRYMMDTCEAHGLLCELQEGTLLGAVKEGGVLAWERDADITFHTKNFTALTELRDVFERVGYSLYLTDNRWCCVDGRWAGGQGSLSSGQWRAELWSQHAMDSEENTLAGRPRTRVEFDGSWVTTPSSPAQYVRNRYGLEVFRHAQHWLDTGHRSGWEEYEAGRFLPCPRPAHHACLDQFVPDGNLRLHPLCVR